MSVPMSYVDEGSEALTGLSVRHPGSGLDGIALMRWVKINGLGRLIFLGN